MRTQPQSSETGTQQPLDLLVVGTFGGGGIHQYIDEQLVRFSERVSARSYDMVAAPTGSGPVWFLRALLRSLWAVVLFPFRPPPDVVHVHTSHRFSFYRASFYVLFAAHVWQRPVVVHVHGSSFDEFARTDDIAVRSLQNAVFSAADRIVVLSEYWRDVLAGRVDPEKLVVVPNAVDPAEYDPSYDAEPPRVVFVSNLFERKGVPTLVEALDRLASGDRDFEADIAGKGPFADDVRALATAHESVTYHGYVSEEQKRTLLNEGTIYVLPSHAEGLPIAMLEGMAGGNAIVSTNVGSIPEVIGDENGVVIDPADTDALVDALERLVEDDERAVRMGRHNRALVESDYSWAGVIDTCESIYAELVEGVTGTH